MNLKILNDDEDDELAPESILNIENMIGGPFSEYLNKIKYGGYY